MTGKSCTTPHYTPQLFPEPAFNLFLKGLKKAVDFVNSLFKKVHFW